MKVQANRECPRFARCAVNNCPLTEKYPDWPIAPDDGEKKCGLGKTYRHRIGRRYPELRMQGLTPREWAAKKNWENLSDEERQIRRDRGKNLRKPLPVNGGTQNGVYGPSSETAAKT